MDITDHERRREPRYLVTELKVSVDGVVCYILDISPSAVRLTQPDGWDPSRRNHTLVFEWEGGNSRLTVETVAWTIRSSALSVVLGFNKPFPTWSTFLRALDTFSLANLKTAPV